MPWQDRQIEPDRNAVVVLVALAKGITIEGNARRLKTGEHEESHTIIQPR